MRLGRAVCGVILGLVVGVGEAGGPGVREVGRVWLVTRGEGMEAVRGAVGMWRGCGGYGRSMPGFEVVREGDERLIPAGSLVFRVRWANGPSPLGTCAAVMVWRRELWLWGGVRNERGDFIVCPRDPSVSIAHEIGHIYGLDHCDGCPLSYIMSTMDRSGKTKRVVSEEECLVLSLVWATTSCEVLSEWLRFPICRD